MAAEQGYAIAQANLGWCYDTGSGVAQDEAEAVKWYREAAEQGDETSQFNLGVHHEWGSGVERDKQEALKWYRKAADRGYEKAAKALEKLISEVQAQKKDKEEKAKAAEERFRKACAEELAEGTLTLDDSHRLRVLADSLEISEQLSKTLFGQEKANFLRSQKAQPGPPKGEPALGRGLAGGGVSLKAGEGADLKFRIACKNAINDGKISLAEKDSLGRLGKSLNLPVKVMKHLFEEEKRIFKASQKVQPTKSIELQFRKVCKEVLGDGKFTPEEEKQLKGLAGFFKMPNDVMKEIFADEVRICRHSRRQFLNKEAILQFSMACKKALADGKSTPEEEQQLKSLANYLKIPKEIMLRILGHEARLYQKTH